MFRFAVFLFISLITLSQCAQADHDSVSDDLTKTDIRLITLNPGHFHAALIQKKMLDGMDPVVHIYAPEGDDLELHLSRIDNFNNRDHNPAHWQSVVYAGQDYLEKMLEEKPGNVVVTAGNNQLKTDYIRTSVQAGLHVLSDKPMAIDKEGWLKLKDAFAIAEKEHVLLYDIMTERSETNTRLLRALSQNEQVFGQIEPGSPEKPAIQLESVHHLFKYVSGEPLRRPPWYFDVNRQGEGIVDVTTHLVDLSMWILFPGQPVNHNQDIDIISARRYPTPVTLQQFQNITGHDAFPTYLENQRDEDGILPLYCNGEITYRLRDFYVSVGVNWEYQAAPGGDDTHHTYLRGSRSTIAIRQGPDQNFQRVLYVRPVEDIASDDFEASLHEALVTLKADFPGISAIRDGDEWRIDVPEHLNQGHEAHFSEVATRYFRYIDEGKLPDWEIPNMLSKYYITTTAREMALDE